MQIKDAASVGSQNETYLKHVKDFLFKEGFTTQQVQPDLSASPQKHRESIVNDENERDDGQGKKKRNRRRKPAQKQNTDTVNDSDYKLNNSSKRAVEKNDYDAFEKCGDAGYEK